MASATSVAVNRRESQLIAALNAADWDFHDSGNAFDAHNIHPFPAKFIPEIPRQILSLVHLTPKSVVLDPFAGSGTALLEAQRAGYDFVGVDLNPIAILISRVKTNGGRNVSLKAARELAASARTRFQRRDFTVPNIPRLNHWFRPEIAAAMSCITHEIGAAALDTKVKDFLRLSVSAITVRVSNQESETRYAALSKQRDPTEVFRLFERSAESIVARLQKTETLFSTPANQGLIIQSDAREIGNIDLPRVSLVITSPPYPNAYEYWLYNKYRMYWLGFDPVHVREHEIGARPHYASENGNSIRDFLQEMAAVFRGISKHLTAGAYVAVLISSKCRIRGQVFDLPTLLENTLADVSYVPLTRMQRTIPRTRKAFNPEIGSIESETLLFMRWSGN